MAPRRFDPPRNLLRRHRDLESGRLGEVPLHGALIDRAEHRLPVLLRECGRQGDLDADARHQLARAGPAAASPTSPDRPCRDVAAGRSAERRSRRTCRSKRGKDRTAKEPKRRRARPAGRSGSGSLRAGRPPSRLRETRSPWIHSTAPIVGAPDTSVSVGRRAPGGDGHALLRMSAKYDRDREAR